MSGSYKDNKCFVCSRPCYGYYCLDHFKQRSGTRLSHIYNVRKNRKNFIGVN